MSRYRLKIMKSFINIFLSQMPRIGGIRQRPRSGKYLANYLNVIPDHKQNSNGDNS